MYPYVYRSVFLTLSSPILTPRRRSFFSTLESLILLLRLSLLIYPVSYLKVVVVDGDCIVLVVLEIPAVFGLFLVF